MRGTPEQESEILTQILSFRDDPISFVHWCYPWGKVGTPFERGLRKWQLEDLQRIGEHTREQVFRLENHLPLQVYKGATASGRGPGKSAEFGMIAHWHMSTRIGAPTIVSADTEGQLRSKTFPEFATWFGAAINSHWFVIDNLRISPAQWLIDLVKGLPEEGGLGIDPRYWYVAGQTWSDTNPNAFAGAHNPYGMLVLFDEANGIATPVWNVTEGFFTEINAYRYWLAASQRRTRSGRFHEIFEDKLMGADWHKKTLSTRGMEGIDQAVIEGQIRKYGADSDFVRMEIDGLPPRTSEDQFISWDAVRVAQQNELIWDQGEPLILGVDPAPRGRTAWAFRHGRNARNCCGPMTRGIWQGLDNVQIAEKILELDRKYKPDAICIDFGMGTGVIDILKRKRIHGRLHEVKFGTPSYDKDNEWATHAIELWARLRDWLSGGMIQSDDGEKGTLSAQMTNRGWRWSGKEDGKKILETKEDLAKRGVMSPDDVDALACTFEVNPPRNDSTKSGKPVRAEGVDASMTDDWE